MFVIFIYMYNLFIHYLIERVTTCVCMLWYLVIEGVHREININFYLKLKL